MSSVATATSKVMMETARPKRFSEACSGVSASAPLSIMLWIAPICVARPMPTTTPVPCPATHIVPAKPQQAQSPTLPPPPGCARMDLSTGSDSPVSADSRQRSDAAEMKRTSAPSESPACTCKMSPTTTSAVSTTTSCPSRRTVLRGASSRCSAAAADAALPSVSRPMSTLMMIIRLMSTKSAQSVKTAATTAATTSEAISALASCAHTRRSRPGPGFAGATLRPYAARAASTSAPVSPDAREAQSDSASPTVSVCHFQPCSAWSAALCAAAVARALARMTNVAALRRNG